VNILSYDEVRIKYPDIYQYISSTQFVKIEDGRYDINGNTYVNIETYTTESFEHRRYESHRRYIDLQCVLSGEENLYVHDIKTLVPCTDYDIEKDIIFYKRDYKMEPIKLNPQICVELYPNDGHMPCVMFDKPRKIRKAVFKILIK